MARFTFGWLAMAGIWLAAGVATAQTDSEMAREDRIAELERKVDVLVSELERTRADLAVPETAPELESAWGLGPAASKIYGVAQGLSIGGYGEGNYENLVSDSSGESNSWDALRSVLYVGYKFNERILWNMEIEFEHATTSSTVSASNGSVSVEFGALDFLMHPAANARVGLLLVPVGFINLLHEPPFFFGVDRPEVERRIIPTTWRENGTGLFGTLFGETVQYQTYVMNGFNAEGFDSSGLRGGRQKGNRAFAEHLSWVGRVDATLAPGFTVGGSVYVGKSGQNQEVSGSRIPDTFTTLWELHSEYKYHGVSFRALFTMAHLEDSGRLTQTLQDIGELGATEAVAGEMLGGYGEIAYDILPLIFPGVADYGERSFEPFFRFEFLDTQRDTPFGLSDPAQETFIYTTGFSFKPIPNVVLKADYKNRDSNGGDLPDELNLGFGFVF